LELKNKSLLILPLILIFLLSTPITYSAYDYLLFKSGVYFKQSATKGTFTSNINLYTSKCEFTEDFIYFTNLYSGSGIWPMLGFSTSPSNAEITLTQITSDKIRLNIMAPSGTSTTKIYLASKGAPTETPGQFETEYDSGTKTFTVYVDHTIFSSQSFYLSWSQLNFADHLIGGNWVTGFAEFYTAPLGVAAPALVILTLSLAAYIKTQSLTYVIGLWFLAGAAIEIYLPGPALMLGRILMILGIFVLLLKLFLGNRETYG